MTIPARVRKYIDDLIKIEGDYVDHPSDRGGPTRWGITEFVARAAGYTGDMRELPRELAADIYLAQYWLDPGFDQIEEIDPIVAVELFDTGVNMGPSVASTFLQEALNSLNERGKAWPDLKVDGAAGRLTREALRAYYKRRGPVPACTVLMRLLDAQQAVRYMSLAKARETQEDFMFGWVSHRIGGNYGMA